MRERSVGNQKFYRANRDSPVFRDLHGLIVKTVGIVEPLSTALAPLASKIHVAFVHGSVAAGTERAESDIDLIVISDTATYPDVYEALQAAEAKLGRKIEPTVLTRNEWRARRDDSDSFVARVASRPKLFVHGSEDDLA